MTARRVDWLAYVWGSVPGAALAFAAGAGLLSEGVAIAILAVSFVGLNVAHMAATWSRVWLDPAGWRAHPLERLALPALLLLAPVALEAIGYGAALLGLQYYLSAHHASMQNYGILRWSQRRSGRAVGGSLRLDQAACLLPIMGAVVWRASVVAHEYGTASLWAPPVELAAAVLAAGVTALVAWLAREILAWRAGQPLDSLGIGVVVAHGAIWGGLIIGLSHPMIPLYALASGHYVQYLTFVWRVEEARPGLGAIPSPVRGFLSPPARLRWLLGMVAIGGGGVLALTFLSVGLRALAETAGLRATSVDIPPWAAAMLGVNLSHYWLDHRIWRAPAPRARLDAERPGPRLGHHPPGARLQGP